MALDQKFFKKSTAATGLADQEEGLVLHLDANDVDSYDGDGNIWYDINGHEINIPVADKASNLQLDLNASDTASYSGIGATWTDISGNSRNGAITGATFASDIRGYFQFDGSAKDRIKISDTALVQSNGTNFTVEAWVRRAGTGTHDYIASQTTDNGNSQNWLLRFTNSNTLGWFIYGTDNYLTTSTTYSANVWYHVVGLVESNGTSRIYVDGTLVTSSSSGRSADTQSYNTFIGSLGDGSYATMGDIDIAQVKIYDVALTAEEIGQNYRAGNFLSYSSIITSKHEATQGSLVTVPPVQGTLHTSNLALSLDANVYTSGSWSNTANSSYNATVNGAAHYNDNNSDYFDFDGSNDYAEVTAYAGTDIGNSGFTFEAWALCEASSGTDTIVSNIGGDLHGYQLLANGTNVKLYVYAGSDPPLANVQASSSIVVNTWNHYSFTVSSTSSGAAVKLYINGSEAATGSLSGAYSGANTSFNIGKYPYAPSNRYFEGKIAQVRTYSAALTPAQITTNYNATKDLYQGVTSLAFSLDANGHSGTYWTDSVGSINGTINGATYVDDNNSDYFNFDGSNDYISIAATETLDTSNVQSFELWFQPGNEQHAGHILTRSNSSFNPRGYAFRHNSDEFQAFFYSGTSAKFNQGFSVTRGEWTHAVVTIAGTTSGSAVKMYKNGVEVVSGTLSGDIATDSSFLTIIGRRNLSSSYDYFNGKIAQVRAYKGTMSAAQVKANYNATKALYRNPIALIDYRPDQYSGSGTSITNLGSLSNDAVLTGGIESTYDKELGDFFTIDGGSNTGDGIETTSNVTGVNLSTDGFTWELWINNTSDTFSYILSFNYSTTDYNLSYRSNLDKIQFFGGTIAQTPTLQLNRWYHIVASANSNGKNLYLDGVLVDSNTSAAANHNLNSKLYFGTYHSHSESTHIHTGPIGDARFYKGVLTAEQVAQNYLATKSKYPNGFNLSLFNNPTWNATDKAFSLNGSNQYFYNPGYVFDFGTNDYTVIIWFNSDNAAQGNALFSLYNTQGLMIDLWTGGVVRHYHDGSGSGLQYYTSETVTTGTWYQLAVTLNRANNLASMFLSTKSTFDSTASTSAIGSAATRSGNGGTNIGRYNSGFYFDGKIANVRVYQKALSSSEIEAVWNTDKNNIP